MSTKHKKVKNRLNLKQIILISSLSIALIAIIVCVFMFSRDNSVPDNPDNVVGNTAGNLYNGGLFCEYNDRIYFNNSYDNNYLYSMDLNGSDYKLIAKVPAKFICCAGDYLYYYHDDKVKNNYLGVVGSPAGYYRISLKNNKKTLNLDRAASLSMNVIGNKMFYLHSDPQKGMFFYSSNLDGTDKKQISDEQIFPCSFRNGKIYYCDIIGDLMLREYNIATGQSRAYLAVKCYNPTIVGNMLYYLDCSANYALCSYDFDDDTIRTLTKDRVDTFNVYDNVIYYQKSSSQSPALIRIGTDGSNPEIVAEGNYHNINCTRTYTYFQAFDDNITTYKTPTFGSVNVTNFRPEIQ